MSLDVEVETIAKQVHGLTQVKPATFRGVDCALLAERYAAYRRDMGLDEVRNDPDEIITAAAPSSENA